MEQHEPEGACHSVWGKQVYCLVLPYHIVTSTHSTHTHTHTQTHTQLSAVLSEDSVRLPPQTVRELKSQLVQEQAEHQPTLHINLYDVTTSYTCSLTYCTVAS